MTTLTAEQYLNEMLGLDVADEATIAPDLTFAQCMAKLSPNHAAFVRGLLSGKTRTDAYRAAYPDSSHRHAGSSGSSLCCHPDVARAIAAGRKEARSEAQYDLKALVAQLDDAIDFAKETGNAAALVKAIEAKGKAFGLLIDRSQVDVVNRVDLSSLMLEGQTRMDRLIDATAVPVAALPRPKPG